MGQGTRWGVWAAVGVTAVLSAVGVTSAEARHQDRQSTQDNAVAQPDVMGDASVALTQGDARALASQLELLFGVGASATPWRDGLRTMADLPAISFDATDEQTLHIRAPQTDLAAVVAVARAIDQSRADGGSIVRVFGFAQPTQAQAAVLAMQRLASSKLLPGKGPAFFEAPTACQLLVALAPGAAHPMLERIARDYGGTVVSLAQRSDEQIRLALERERALQRKLVKSEPAAPVVEIAAIAPLKEAPTVAVSPRLQQASEPVGMASAKEPAPRPEPVVAPVAPIVADALPAVVASSERPEAEPIEVAATSSVPSVSLPDAPKPPAMETTMPAPVVVAAEPFLEPPAVEGAPAAATIKPGASQRVVRVVVLQAADALAVGPRVQQVAARVFDDVQVVSASAGNALLVAGQEDEVDLCALLLEDIDAAAARMTEGAMLVMLDGAGANDVASAVQRLVQRPGGELGVRVASDEARGAIMLTGPNDAATLVGGLAEAIGRIDALPASASEIAVAQAAPRAQSAISQPPADEPRSRAEREVVVRAIRPEGELRQTAEFVRALLERAGVSPVRVTDLLPGRSLGNTTGDTRIARRRKLLVPKRIRMIIKYSQTTLAQLFDGRPRPELAPFEQVFAMPESDAQVDPRLEVIVLPDRQALALVGDVEAVTKGAELADALGGAWGQDRIEVVRLKHANAEMVARMIERVLAQEPGAGGQLHVSFEPRLNMVVLSGPSGAARRGAALAHQMDLNLPGPTQPNATPSPTQPPTPTPPPAGARSSVGKPAAQPKRAKAQHVPGDLVAVGYVLAADAAQHFEGLASMSEAGPDLGDLVDALVAQGQARVLGRHVLATSADGHVSDGPGPFASGVWMTGEPLKDGAIRVELLSEPANGDQATVDLPPGALLVLCGSVREGSGQAVIDLTQAPVGRELGLVLVQVR
ncbi:MAG: hypothetical protein KDA20_04175 [Phycisphaerales bacterium]|nr:hypothetical protein [Phycisphaerales bacterium]